MTTETILTLEQIHHLWDTRVMEPTEAYPLVASDKIMFARAIEQAVLQSHEIQALRKDAELYRWIKENIKEGYEFDGGYYISDTDTKSWDSTIRAAMEQQI